MKMMKGKKKGKLGPANGVAKKGAVNRGASKPDGKAKLAPVKNTRDMIKSTANKVFMS